MLRVQGRESQAGRVHAHVAGSESRGRLQVDDTTVQGVYGRVRVQGVGARSMLRRCHDRRPCTLPP